MALIELHTNWLIGTYQADRELKGSASHSIFEQERGIAKT